MLRSLIGILRASLAQIDTEMAEKYAKLAEKYAQLGNAAKFSSLYDIGRSNPVPASGLCPDPAQKLVSSSMSRHLSTQNISSKSMHAFLSNLAHRHTDRQTNEHGRAGENIISSFVGGK